MEPTASNARPHNEVFGTDLYSKITCQGTVDSLNNVGVRGTDTGTVENQYITFTPPKLNYSVFSYQRDIGSRTPERQNPQIFESFIQNGTEQCIWSVSASVTSNCTSKIQISGWLNP